MNKQIHMEQQLLGAILRDGSLFGEISSLIDADHFTIIEHVKTFKGMTDLFEARIPIDIITTAEKIGSIKGEDSFPYLAELGVNHFSAKNVVAYANIIASYGLGRELKGAVIRAQKVLGNDGPPEEMLSEVQQIFSSIETGSSRTGAVMVKEVMKTAIAELDERFNSDGSMVGIPTGLRHLDDITSGLQRSDLIIIAARPSMGKTNFLLKLAATACDENKGSLIFSMEMSKTQLVNRLSSMLSRVPFERIQNGKLLEDDWGVYTSAAQKIAEWNMAIDDTPALTINELVSRAEKFHKKNPVSAIFVDYIQLMRANGRSRNEEVGEMSAGLKALAKTLDIPVIALSQLSRGVESRPDKRPMMSDLRDSGSLEQDADVIAFIYRDEVYNPSSIHKGLAEILIRKQRNGPVGSIHVEANFHVCRFDDFEGVLPIIEEKQEKGRY